MCGKKLFKNITCGPTLNVCALKVSSKKAAIASTLELGREGNLSQKDNGQNQEQLHLVELVTKTCLELDGP